MPMQINTNVMALNALRNLSITGTRLAKSLEQLLIPRLDAQRS